MIRTPDRNITADLSAHAQIRPGAPAIVLGERTISYAELDDAVWRTLSWLRDAGIRPGMIVGLIMANQISLLLTMLGLMRLGATAFPLSPGAPVLQNEELLREAQADVALSDPGVQTLPNFRIIGFHEEHLRSVRHDEPRLLGGTDAPCLLIPGSGTTGRPSLMPVSHRSMVRRTEGQPQVYDLRAGDRFMVVSPLHFHASNGHILATLAGGRTGVLWNQRGSLAAAVLSSTPDILHLSVFHSEIIMREAEGASHIDFSSIRIISIGSSTISEDLRQRLRDKLRAKLQVNYGTNEVATISFVRLEDLIVAPGSVGRPLPGVEVEILDESGASLPPGQVGTVRVRSPAQITGYLHHDNDDRFRDGWFYPGDLAMRSKDGQIFHYGRADQMMIMNGINIYPAEIERVLEQHPAVRDVVAFPLKHPRAQEVPVCAVVLHPGATPSRADVSRFARERLGARAPHFVAILDEVPRNEQGKPKRPELLRLVEQQLARLAEASATGQVASPADKSRLAPSENVRLRQPSRRINLDFKPPTVLQPSAIDAWLKILNPDFAIPVVSPASHGAGEQAQGIADWLHRVMLLVRELLQVAAIPVFDTPMLISCRHKAAESATWRAVIAMPVVDHVTASTYKIAFGTAVRTTNWMMAHEPTVDNLEALFVKLTQDAIEPIKKFASGGKSTMPLLQAAHMRGIPFRSLGGGVYQLGLGARGRLTDRSTNDRDSAIGFKLAQSKPLTAQALRLAGLPAPTHQVVSSIADARAVAERLGWPVVVKPADLDRGEGVSVDVEATRLQIAFDEAQCLSPTKQVVVERQVEGICHRLYLASGRLLYAVKRLPMGVYGDGTHSIEALVSAELTVQARRPPWRRSELRPIDDLAREAIRETGLIETSIPEAGRFIPLRRLESTAWGGIDEDVTDNIHPENLRVALAAAELLGLDVAGIDIISSDLSVPWHRNGAIINEVNVSPLLGGGEISRRHIGEYLTRLLQGDGRIPIEAFLGGEMAWRAALERGNSLGGEGSGIFITNSKKTLGGDGHEIPMPFQSLYERCRALLLSRQVRTLLLVVQDDEWLRTGLPVEYLDSFVDAGGGLRRHQNLDLTLPKEEEQAMRHLLAERVRATGA